MTDRHSAREEAADTRPIDRQFDVGGYDISYRCAGSGSPTVILDAGLGFGLQDWEHIQGEVAAFTRVCSYDRAGIGGSGLPPKPRTADSLVMDLHRLLHGASIPGPYVLVGHSIAGLIVLLYAHRFPDETSGLVLVDASHPGQFDVVREVLAPRDDESAETAQFREFHTEVYKDWTQNPEGIDIVDLCVRAEEVARLHDIPVALLTSGFALRDAALGTEHGSLFHERWSDLHRQYADLAPGSTHLVLENSDHRIHDTDPQAVIRAIKGVVEEARRQEGARRPRS